MRFDIRHHTLYTYSIPVLLGPQTVRLRPRPDGGMREMAWNLKLAPEPQSRSDQLDAEGNLLKQVGHLTPVEQLESAYQELQEWQALRKEVEAGHAGAGKEKDLFLLELEMGNRPYAEMVARKDALTFSADEQEGPGGEVDPAHHTALWVGGFGHGARTVEHRGAGFHLTQSGHPLH